MNSRQQCSALPVAVEQWLKWAGQQPRSGHSERLRLSPLILKRSLDETVARRKWLFHHFICEQCPHGLYIRFRRSLRPCAKYPRGRTVDGDFNVLDLGDDVVIIASALGSDAHTHGPQLLWQRSYPLAIPPFVTSLVMMHAVEEAVASMGWQATCVDATGYCIESRAFRRDTKRQPIAATCGEMAQQGRHLHRAELSLYDEAERERARFSVDRMAQASIRIGDPRPIVAQLMLPMVERFRRQSAELSVEKATRALDQRAVVLTFPDNTFADNEDLETLCDTIRQSPGLGVSVVHLNPYLQAQVLDYLSGATVSIIVATSNRVAIVPRCGDVNSAVGRIAMTVFQSFGEGKATVERLKPQYQGGLDG